MNIRKSLTVILTIVTNVALAAILLPAHAHAFDDRAQAVSGYGWTWNDWNDNSTIHRGSARSDLVAMWQGVLAVSGHFDVVWPKTDIRSRVDGQFGYYTYRATISWQRYHGLGADGIVGPQTWYRASLYLKQYTSREWDVAYYGKNSRKIYFLRETWDRGLYRMKYISGGCNHAMYFDGGKGQHVYANRYHLDRDVRWC